MLMSLTDWTTRQRSLASIGAPTEDGQRLSVPSLDCLEDLIAHNGRQRLVHDYDIQGRSLVQLAEEARGQLFTAALNFTRAYCDVATVSAAAESMAMDRPTKTGPPSPSSAGSSCTGPGGPLIMTGHQPEIVHPGVWLKNFTAAQLANRCHGTAIHLIIDSDLSRAPAIRVPTGSAAFPRSVTVPYDRPTEIIPLEQRPWIDRSVWDSFGTRVYDTIAPLVPNAMVRSWWAQVAAPAAEAPTLALGLARARHLTEISWQTSSAREIRLERSKADAALPSRREHTLELPQSRVCQLPAFRRFTIHLLTQLPRFRDAYNGALAHYRQVHKIRNHAQPVPDLSAEDGWIEAPFWIWSRHDPMRRPLWVRFETDSLRLTDRHQFDKRLPVAEDGLPDEAMACLVAWEADGVKLRTRALLTTLFARLMLADLFIHGIGGAKYDLVTDAISAQFYGFAPPEFLTLSGTLRLPIDQNGLAPGTSGPANLAAPGPRHTANQMRKNAQTLRELTYHPEWYVDLTTLLPSQRQTVQTLLQQKEHWIRTEKTPQNASQRHQAIARVNAALQPWLSARRMQLEQELAGARSQAHADLILQSREYAFCLFPANRLQDFLLDF